MNLESYFIQAQRYRAGINAYLMSSKEVKWCVGKTFLILMILLCHFQQYWINWWN